MAIETSLFKKALGRFVTGVTVVSTNHKDTYYGVTINSFSSVSLEPPLILYCLDKKASVHDVFVNSENFTVNILSETQKGVAEHFARRDKSDWTSTPHLIGKNTVPLVKDSAATIECKKHHVYEGGDHHIIIGLVTNLIISEVSPLVYFQGGYNNIQP